MLAKGFNGHLAAKLPQETKWQSVPYSSIDIELIDGDKTWAASLDFTLLTSGSYNHVVQYAYRHGLLERGEM